MTPRTYRRKLQKKLKHQPYLQCPVCKERAWGKLTVECILYKCVRWSCGLWRKEKRWTGGGKVDTYRAPDPGKA